MLNYSEYFIVFQVSIVMALLMFLVTMMIFIFLKIPKVFEELTGDLTKTYVIIHKKKKNFVIEKSIVMIHTEEVIY
jgi:hypothetical protein